MRPADPEPRVRWLCLAERVLILAILSADAFLIVEYVRWLTR